MAEKEVVGEIKLQVDAGQATPAPPVGPALGQHGVNIGEFVNQFNSRTKDQIGLKVPVVLHRKNNKPWLAIVPLEELGVLAFLIHEALEKVCQDAQESVNGKAKIRTCLKCEKRFSSWGPGNRICKKCDRTNEQYVNMPDSMIERGQKYHNGDIIS